MKCPKCQADNPETKQFCGDCGTQLTPQPEAKLAFTETLETSSEDLTRGTLFAGRYEIIEELGKGGMGKVYRVEDTKIKQEIALKLIKPEIASDKKTIERFKNELKTTRNIRHKNVCGMFDLGEEKGTHYIAMEYVSGGDLKKLIRRTKRLDSGTAISIAKQICEGLAEAHGLGIVHRDLKPSNIMLDDNGNARIMDFGIARTVRGKGITGSGVMIGTPEYMSPEQAEAEEVDQRADIYSLGVILYEMATGRLPFEAETPLATALMHKTEEPQDPKGLNPQIPDGLSRVILKCLEKAKINRYQTVNEVSKALVEIEKRIPITEKKSPETRSQTSKEIFVKFNVRKAITSTAIVIFTITVAYIILRSDRSVSLVQPGTMKQISYDPGLELDPDISPDGKMVAFVKGPVGRTQIIVRQISGGRSIAVTQDFSGNPRCPRWSPDGNQLAFFSEGFIYIVPALGGPVRRLIEKVSSGSAYGPAWSPDGEKIAYVQMGAIYVYDLVAKKSEKLSDVEEAYGLSWSPDGSRIAYVSGNLNFIFSNIEIPETMNAIIGNIAPSSIHILSLEDRSIIQVAGEDSLNTSPVWTFDGRQLLFISDRGGARDIYTVPLKSSGVPAAIPTRVTTGLDAHSISLSHDGKMMIFSRFNFTSNIYSMDIPEKGPSSISTARQITEGNQIIETASASFDGKWLVFDSDISGNQDIYKMPIEGGEPIQLTTHPSGDFAPRWSVDGEKIVFHSFRSGSRDVYIMTKNGESVEPVTDDPSHEMGATFAANGEIVAFASDRTDRYELYMASRSPTGWTEPEQITSEGAQSALGSYDQDSIATVSATAVQVTSLSTRRTKKIFDSQGALGMPRPKYPSWSPDGQTIYFAAVDEQGFESIWAIPANGGKPELKVVSDDPNLKISLIGLTADSRRFYFPVRKVDSNIWLMDLITRMP